MPLPPPAARPLLLASLLCVLFAPHASAAAKPAAKPAKTVTAPRAEPAHDEDKRFRIEDALMVATPSALVWSPNGRRLAFVVSAPDTAEDTNNQDVWLADLESGETRRLTRHAKNDYGPTFSPGGDTVAFVSNRETGEDARPRIYLLSLRGGDPWTLGTFDESVGEIEWSPDGRSIAFTLLDTLPKRVKEWRKKKWDQNVEDERLQHNHLWVLDVATAKARRLTSGDFNVTTPHWSPDSRSIAVLTNPTGKPDDGALSDIGVVAATGGPLRALHVVGSGGYEWSPDSRWIAWPGPANRTDEVAKNDLWVIAAAGGTPSNLTAGFDEDAKAPAWSPSGDSLYFHSDQGVSSVVAAVARTGGKVMLGFDRHGVAGSPVIASNGRAAWVQSRAGEPAEVIVADRVTLAGERFSQINENIAKRDFGVTRAVHWTSSDGVTVEGVLLRPATARPGEALRTVVFLHGGPYTDRYALSFSPLGQLFAAAGWQVFMPNFRSSGGYGTAFMLRKRSDWGGQDWRDVTSGVDSLVKWKLADGTRLGVTGGSYGGYLSAWAITQTNRFDAAVVLFGAVELASHYGQSDIQKYRAYDFEGPPWKTPENWRRASPYTYIENVKTPTLILHGRDDPRVPFPQSQQLYRALLGLGVPTQLVSYPREGHGLREPRHRADQWARTLDWFDRWVK